MTKFPQRKGINFCCVQMISEHVLTLNYSLQYARRVISIIESKQQLCIHMLHESLVGKCEYTTQSRVPFGVMLLIQRVQYILLLVMLLI